LEILVYCSQKKCIKLEQKYFNLLKPEYNILKIAGSLLGFKHSLETRAQMSAINEGKQNPMFGKARPAETKAKISASLMGNSNAKNHPHARKIQVLDLKLNTTITYTSFSEAARALNISRPSIPQYFSNNQQKPIKGRYVLTKIDS
jgi:group I intron endonuclease